MSNPTADQKLRVIEPFRMYGWTLAEVFVSKIGLPPSLVMTFDTDDGSEASVTLTAREANDLMLWLQCALNAESEPVCKHNWTLQVQKKDWAIYCCEHCGKFTRRKLTGIPMTEYGGE